MTLLGVLEPYPESPVAVRQNEFYPYIGLFLLGEADPLIDLTGVKGDSERIEVWFVLVGNGYWIRDRPEFY